MIIILPLFIYIYKHYKYSIHAVDVYIISNSCRDKTVAPPPLENWIRARVVHLCNTLLLFVRSFRLCVSPPPSPIVAIVFEEMTVDMSVSSVIL